MYGAQVLSVTLRDLAQLRWCNVIASDAVPGDLPSLRGVRPGALYSSDLQTTSQTNALKQKQ